jgi:hypothetical protein
VISNEELILRALAFLVLREEGGSGEAGKLSIELKAAAERVRNEAVEQLGGVGSHINLH